MSKATTNWSWANGEIPTVDLQDDGNYTVQFYAITLAGPFASEDTAREAAGSVVLFTTCGAYRNGVELGHTCEDFDGCHLTHGCPRCEWLAGGPEGSIDRRHANRRAVFGTWSTDAELVSA